MSTMASSFLGRQILNQVCILKIFFSISFPYLYCKQMFFFYFILHKNSGDSLIYRSEIFLKNEWMKLSVMAVVFFCTHKSILPRAIIHLAIILRFASLFSRNASTWQGQYFIFIFSNAVFTCSQTHLILFIFLILLQMMGRTLESEAATLNTT